MKKELKAKGVEVAKMDGSEVARMRALGGGRAEGQGNQAPMVSHGKFQWACFLWVFS